MPPRKYSRKFKKTGGSKFKTTVKKLALQAIKQNAEWKHHLTHVNNVGVTTSGTIYDLSGIAQGDTDQTRDGDMVQASTISLLYHMYNGDDNNCMRVIVFQYHTDTTPTVTNIVDNSVGNGCLFHYKIDNASQFKIMYDSFHELNSPNTGETVFSRVIRRKLRIPRRKIQFTAGTTTGTNKVYALLLSDSSVVPNPGVTIVSKLNYMDN